MAAVLVEIRDRTGTENKFLGDSEVRRLRGEVAKFGPGTQPGIILQTLIALGNAEVDLGRIEEGIEVLQKAETILQHTTAPDAIMAEVHSALGNAFFRLGETENCCARHAPESCIVPLAGAAIHTQRRGSEEAIKQFHEVMKRERVDPYLKLKCAWLSNLAYMTLGDYPDKVPAGIRLPESAFQSKVRFPRFANVAGGLGLDKFTLSGGAVFDDFDGDHDLDLITSSWETSVSMIYNENQGDGTFVERSQAAGFESLLGGLNIVQGDYDNDGDLDLYVLRGAWLGENGEHPNSLLENQGDGSFVDVTFAAGMGKKPAPTQTAAWADYDNDGDLDLYVGNEAGSIYQASSQLYQNQGDGTFIDVAYAAGVTNDRYTKGVVWGDVNADRWPDLVVSNLDDFNRLYINQGDGTFKDMASEAGVQGPQRSFPVWTWDYDNDGLLDIFISSYAAKTGDFMLQHLGQPRRVEPPGIYRGIGDGRFENVAEKVGLGIPMLPMGSNFGDLNNDGFLDFYLGTGEPAVSVILPNMMFLNRAGERFDDVTMAGGFGHLQKGHAVVFADMDGDGDQDVFEQMGGAKPVDRYRDALYENPGFGGAWLKVRLVGTQSNRFGVGARIRAQFEENGQERTVFRHLGSGGSFGANPLREHIGLGKITGDVRLEVYWPTSDTTQVIEAVAPNQMIEITEGQEGFRAIGS